MTQYIKKDAGRADWNAPLPEKLPKPSVWPMVVAFGSCLLAWGIVTSWIISVVGLVAFITGITGWVMDMRNEQSGE